MPRVTVRDETGNIIEKEVLSRSASVIPDNQDEFEPAVVERVEYDHTGQTSSITSVCGETENRRESNEQPDITIEGVLVEDQLPDIKSLKEGDEITLVSDVHQGQVYVKRVTIEQSTDIIHFIQNGTRELAFGFQLQLGQPGTDT